MGGAFFVSAAQSAFTNQLISSLKTHAPDVDPLHVIAVGATELRSAFAADQIPGIIVSYMDGLRVVFALCIALAGCSTLISFAMPWVSIKGKAAPGAV